MENFDFKFRDTWRDTSYKRQGMEFHEVYRENDAVIFQEKNKPHFEVHIRKYDKEGLPKNFLATNSTWGINGFTHRTFEDAMNCVKRKLNK